MEKFYQQFHLSSKTPKEKICPEARETLMKKLLDKGYDILGSNLSHCGIPENIIVAGQIGMRIKEDFFNITNSLGLQFTSRHVYTPVSKSLYEK